MAQTTQPPHTMGGECVVVLEHGDLCFWNKGRMLARQPLPGLKRAVRVYAGTALYSTDIEFALLDFGASLWVLPEDARMETDEAWREHLCRCRGFFELTLAWPPKSWLDGGFMGLLRRPAARVLFGEGLEDPHWLWRGPLEPWGFEPLK